MTQSNGQRPSNPHRFAIFRSKPFPDNRPPSSEFSITTFLPLELVRDLYNALSSGAIQPDRDNNGALGFKLWGNAYRGTGQPDTPVMNGFLSTPKALWQAQQAAQRDYQQPTQQSQPPAGPTLPGEQFPAPAPAPAAAAPAPMPVAPLPPAPAPAPAQPAWGANQWTAAEANANLPF